MKKLTADHVRSLLDYNPSTGIFIWKMRTADMFSDGNTSAEKNCSSWNKKYAGKEPALPKRRGYPRIAVGLARKSGKAKFVSAHRVVWLIIHGRLPINQIDHINGDRTDNRFCNLREATNSENAQNRKLSIMNSSGYTGVSWHKRKSKWVARVGINYRRMSLGNYDTPEEAYAAYLSAKKKLHSFQPEPRKNI